jgi:hypothetical protein
VALLPPHPSSKLSRGLFCDEPRNPSEGRSIDSTYLRIGFLDSVAKLNLAGFRDSVSSPATAFDFDSFLTRA